MLRSLGTHFSDIFCKGCGGGGGGGGGGNFCYLMFAPLNDKVLSKWITLLKIRICLGEENYFL